MFKCPFHREPLTIAADRKTATCPLCGLTWKNTPSGLVVVRSASELATAAACLDTMRRMIYGGQQ